MEGGLSLLELIFIITLACHDPECGVSSRPSCSALPLAGDLGHGVAWRGMDER